MSGETRVIPEDVAEAAAAADWKKRRQEVLAKIPVVSKDKEKGIDQAQVAEISRSYKGKTLIRGIVTEINVHPLKEEKQEAAEN